MADDVRTSWTLIRGAAAGRTADREEFARRYLPAVRAYLRARWRGSPQIEAADDATQEVLLRCFQRGGILERADSGRPSGFRAFLFGAVQNVARAHERASGGGRREHRLPTALDAADEGESPEEAFDRAWARSIMRQAAARMAERARTGGRKARRRVELLELRFEAGLPIRAIAERWEEDAARLHREYARARAEFKRAVQEVVQEHHDGSPADLDAEWRSLLEALS